MTLSTSYMEEVKDQILYLLANEILTTREMEARLTLSYPTIRRALVDLEESKHVVKFDKRARNARYTLAPNDLQGKVKSRIPSVSFKGKSIPLTSIYLDQGIEKIGQDGADAVLKAWTIIATTARRLAQGGIPEPILLKKLNREKVNLAQARANLEQLVFIINQLMDNEKLWSSESLISFEDDPSWDEFTERLDELYTHYYGAGDN